MYPVFYIITEINVLYTGTKKKFISRLTERADPAKIFHENGTSLQTDNKNLFATRSLAITFTPNFKFTQHVTKD